MSDGFMKDSEKLPKTPLPDDEVTDSLLEEFFKHFILVCSTVNEEDLDNKVIEQWENTIVPQLCTDQLSSIATENACAAMTEYVFNWMKSRNGGTLSERDIESFYAQIIHKIQFLQLQGVTAKRLSELHQSSIEIKRERLATSSFYSHLSSTNGTNDSLLHRSHYDTGLVAKIVWETLELQTTYEYIFLDDESYWHQRPALEGIFLHLNKNITLVVECKNGRETSRLVEHSREKINNELANHQKKVIFIEQIGDAEVKADSCVERFLMRDLTPGSKRNIFERHRHSRHFGSNVQLEEIVNDEDDLMYLFDLTKQQSPVKDVIEQRYSKIEPWYIDRTVRIGQRRYETKKARYRTTAQMKKFSSSKLSLSTFCRELTSQLEMANSLSAKRFDVGKITQQMRLQNITSQIQGGNKMHIIMDEPGIGKTTYLTWLAKELQQKHPCNWIIPLISIEYATDFAQLSKAHKRIDPTVALRFLFKLLYLAWYVPKINRQSIEETDPVRDEAKRCSDLLTFNASNKVDIDHREASKLESLQLAHLRIFQKKYNDSKVIILFDAFDEIAPHYKDAVLALFVQYSSMPGITQIYLTSRPNMFEDDFLLYFPPNQREFYHLEVFSERDQIAFLDKFLRRKLNDYRTLQGYELLCILHNITDELLGDRKQIPLFMSISSELLLPLVGAHVTFSTDGITVSTNLIEEAKTLFEPQNMMKSFINRKLYILKVEKTDTTDSAYNIPAMQIEAEELNKIKRRKHTLLAMYAMCDESEIDVLLEQSERTEALTYMDEVQLAREKSGIVEAFNGLIPQFLHRTIAEFLVAEWIFNNIAKENVRSFLLSNQYWIYSKRVIRDYLNRMLASGSPIHQAVINQHSVVVKQILKTNLGDANTLDVAGRTPLHLASEVGNLLQHRHKDFGEMLSALLKAYSAVINQRDNVFRWTALEYALRSNSVQAIPMLMQHGAQVDANVLAEQILHCSKDPYEMLKRAASYEKSLWTSRGQYLDRVILTNRMVAQTLINREHFNVYAPIGKENETAIQICTTYNAVELLKSLLLPNNVIDLAFNRDAVDVMEVLITNEHDIPTTIHVTEEILEKCAQHGNTKLFEVLFQKYCQQNHAKHMDQE
uniref:ANK_REP_REGION domain-containing protein n=1 Tax=Anopheles atroparvus TaxID=41427 RepID=A0A182J083_ANOAO